MPDVMTKENHQRRLGEIIAFEADEKACAGWDKSAVREAYIYDGKLVFTLAVLCLYQYHKVLVGIFHLIHCFSLFFYSHGH